MRDPRMFEPLVLALKDSSADVREQAAFGLGQLRECVGFVMLAHGFILTGMLWGAVVAFLIDRKGTRSRRRFVTAGNKRALFHHEAPLVALH